MTFSVIGDHVELQRGNTYKSALLDMPGPFLLGLGSIQRDGGFKGSKLRTYSGPSAEKMLVYPGDMYVSLKDVTQSGDLLGAVARVPDNIEVGRMTQDTVKLLFTSDIDRKYFYWVLRSPQYRQYCRSHGTGTTNLGLSRDDFFNFPIPEFDDKKQKIVNLLEETESKTVLNDKINQTLEQIAQAIFKSWFVDFEPVKAKIAARDALIAEYQTQSGKAPSPQEIAKVEKQAAIAAIAGAGDIIPTAQLQTLADLFPNQLVESELGEIPEGWEISTFSKLAYLDTTSVKPNKESEKIWEHYSIPAFDVDQSPSFDIGESIKSNKYKVSSNAILVSKLNPETRRVWWPLVHNDEAAICSTEFMQFIPLKTENRAFVLGMIESEPFQQGILKRVTGSTGSRQRAQPKEVAELDVVLPNSDLICSFNNLATMLYTKKAENIMYNKTLAALRDALLPKLLSGEIDLKTKERINA